MNVLIEARELAGRLGDPDLAVIDCRFELGRPGWGEAVYGESHLPGALYAHLDRDLSGPIGPATGRHPLPAPAALAGRAAAWGIDDSVRVVAYDQGNGAFAARLWWLLRWLGHQRVMVLDGGFAAWQQAGLPVSATRSSRPPRVFMARPDRARWLSVAQVMAGRDDHSIQLIDARGAERFAGQNETIDPVAGHVPGALNHPFARNLDADGRFLPAAQLRERWLATLGPRPSCDVVAMCGSGVTACHNLLAMEQAGLPGARLYPGSWSEWIRDPARPVAAGAEPAGP